MEDLFGRTIDYLRISITDRCNLRCSYCMPDGAKFIPHDQILRYEEILRLVRCFVSLGVSHYKVTGGEPLVRKGAPEFIRMLKAQDGVKTVTLTTNGILLADCLAELRTAGIDGVNISLDTANRKEYKEITGADAFPVVDAAIRACAKSGIRTKINAVLLRGAENRVLQLAEYAAEFPVDVRFIELMPIGAGKQGGGSFADSVRERLLEQYPDLHPVKEQRGFGPARYEASGRLQGRIGWIDMISHTFCPECNRVRLTSTGVLKPCLCYGDGTGLRELLRNGTEDNRLTGILRETIARKPERHCFSDMEKITEEQPMSRIGG
ncbi:MAG: GTP 3',8-cyclase MoaA [Clostridiales bacterium]|nr:GTP 3',8-cyclase MoaA [Clostridiales bacterium]